MVLSSHKRIKQEVVQKISPKVYNPTDHKTDLFRVKQKYTFLSANPQEGLYTLGLRKLTIKIFGELVRRRQKRKAQGVCLGSTFPLDNWIVPSCNLSSLLDFPVWFT